MQKFGCIKCSSPSLIGLQIVRWRPPSTRSSKRVSLGRNFYRGVTKFEPHSPPNYCVRQVDFCWKGRTPPCSPYGGGRPFQQNSTTTLLLGWRPSYWGWGSGPGPQSTQGPTLTLNHPLQAICLVRFFAFSWGEVPNILQVLPPTNPPPTTC